MYTYLYIKKREESEERKYTHTHSNRFLSFIVIAVKLFSYKKECDYFVIIRPTLYGTIFIYINYL